MNRLVRPTLNDILRAIDVIESAMAGKSLDDYLNDDFLRYGVERGVEIISEAVRRLPPDIIERRPEIPWRQIATIGNILRHEYDQIVDRVIHDVVFIHLPPLKIAMLAIEVGLDEPKEA